MCAVTRRTRRFSLNEHHPWPQAGIAVRPQIGGARSRNHSNGKTRATGRQRQPVFEHQAEAGGGQPASLGSSSQHIVDFRGFLRRRRQSGLSLTRVCQDNQPYTVPIQTAGGIDRGHRDRILEGSAAGVIAEVRERVIRFIEQDNTPRTTR